MLRASLVLLALFTAITGLAYPLAITGISRVVFPRQAAGSLVEGRGAPAGSSLVGQPFSDPRWFWGRPSATAPVPYEGRASSGSNLGPTNPALLDAVKARVAALRAADPGNDAPVPVDLVTASGSGLDPHISPAGAPLPGPARRARPRAARGAGAGPGRGARRAAARAARAAVRERARAEPRP